MLNSLHQLLYIQDEDTEEDDDNEVFNYELEKKYPMFGKHFDTVSNSMFINSFRFCINLNFKFKELTDLNDDLNEMFDESNPTYCII